MNKIQILEMLVYDRLDELIEKGELKNSQVYKDSEGEVELTYVGSQLFCYWYDHYSEKNEKEFIGMIIELVEKHFNDTEMLDLVNLIKQKIKNKFKDGD